jgi:hypothetical protein
VGVEQSHLGLGQPPEAVAELPGRGQQGRLVALEALQRREGQSQELVVVGPERLTGCGLGSSQASKSRAPRSCGSPMAAACSSVVVSWAVGSGYTTLAQSRL